MAEQPAAQQLEPLRRDGSRRFIRLGPAWVNLGWARDWTWGTQNAAKTKQTEYLMGVHRVKVITNGRIHTIFEVFAGPFVAAFHWRAR